MKEFVGHLLEDLNLEEKLTDEEMGRVIRFMLAFEDEAFQLYTHMMLSTDNSRISAVFKDIADEKRFQIAELIGLLGRLNTDAKRLH
jgi:rubrerythrin